MTIIFSHKNIKLNIDRLGLKIVHGLVWLDMKIVRNLPQKFPSTNTLQLLILSSEIAKSLDVMKGK
jgi:hypothetical protein